MAIEQNEKATFYQYRLIRKINRNYKMRRIYMVLPLLMVISEICLFSWSSILFFVLAAPVVIWIQYVISHSVLVIAGQSYRKRWRFSKQFPWFGYMPDQHVGYSIFRRVSLHMTWIGLCVIAVLIPWSPISFILSLIFWHVWSILPRIYTFVCLRKEPKDGMIKFNPEDISYYLQ
ncbi:hypothetical protein PASE110613_16375 [Paenibacillus sediminis]|uniref:Transposase n=1 Tax=Paenibacillus sediminis TaxID=664909 RepID=A0ABS4H7B9_9BACL|nr:hypothetical protein [Paenibacillus sediminis]MBP1938415.1 hypothetical protein [Paenibacillus sediminis]